MLAILAAVGGGFALLLAGSAVLGAGNAAVFLTRYAAAEVGGDAARGRALGTVLFAASLGAVAGPNLLGPSGDLASLLGLPPLAGLYVVAVPCFAAAALLLAAASNPSVPYLGRGSASLGPAERARASGHDVYSGSRALHARAALVMLAAANLVMVAVMAIAPVHMLAHGHGLGVVGIVVGIHVGGMFAPSPISGRLADKMGPAPVAAAGFSLIVAAGVAGAVFDLGGVPSMAAVLLMLGAGWNLAVMGGSTLLAASTPAAMRPRAEGLGEVSMGLAAGMGAPMAGLILALGGFAALCTAGAIVAATVALRFVRRVA